MITWHRIRPVGDGWIIERRVLRMWVRVSRRLPDLSSASDELAFRKSSPFANQFARVFAR
jgi:hypothetical protein